MATPGVFKRISPQDKSITPFKVFKSWRYDSTSSLDSGGPDRLVAIKPNKNVYSGNRVTLDSWQRESDTGSFLVNINNEKEASLVWYSLNHLYYKRAGQPYETFGYTDPYAIERTLYDEASVISIPQKQFGEQIKPGSVKLHLRNSSLNSVSMSLIDDGKGNLIDTALSASISGEVLHLDFNRYTYEKNWTATEPEIVRTEIDRFQVNTLIQDLNVTGKNVWIRPDLALPPHPLVSSIKWGNAAYFSGSYMRIPNREEFNFKRSQDFSISFWVYLESTGSTDSYILSKSTTGTGMFITNGTGAPIITGNVNPNISQYPFEIIYRKSDSTLVCRSANGTQITELTNTLNIGDRKHVTFQKTGSVIELYLDGQYINSKTLPAGNTQNQADVFIGSKGLTLLNTVRYPFNGAISNFFIFNKALQQSEITQLSYTASENLMITNTNAVGNVFYEHGIIVLSDPRYKYGTSRYRMFNDKVVNYLTNITGSGNLDVCRLEYNSTVTLYEHEYLCKLREDEFNFTMNPSIRIDNDANSEIPNSYVGNPYWAPYITTVGLYNSKGELLAIGKLGTPIRKRDNVDTTIIVRFDA